MLSNWVVNKFLFSLIVLWQEERKAAAKKIKDLKLHAKAKINSLEKRIEAMKLQAATVEPIEPHSEEQLPKVCIGYHIFSDSKKLPYFG